MHVAAQPALFAAHDERGLAVRLQTHDAVHHVHAGLLELARPDDVVLFVEAGFELDQRGDLLAVLRGARERGDDRARTAGAIQRLLDGQHLRIVGRAVDEVHDGAE